MLTYGEATGTGKLAAIKGVRGKVAQSRATARAGDPALLDTIDRALLLLKRRRPSPRAGRCAR